MAKLAGGKIDGKSQIVVNDGFWGPNGYQVSGKCLVTTARREPVWRWPSARQLL